jgi:hypothetical protein
LQQQLDRQRRVLRQKPFSEQVIEEHVRSLEAAIRSGRPETITARIAAREAATEQETTTA